MNGLDIAILVVMGLSALLGAIRGMLTEVLSLLVWVAALWITVSFGDSVAAEFTGIATPLLRSLAGYGATFAIVVVVGHLGVWLLRTILHGAGMSGTDRMLGFGFGAARGYAIVLAIVLLVSFTPWSRAQLWRGSTLMPMFSTPAGWIVAQLPDSSELTAFAAPAFHAMPSIATDSTTAGTDAADVASPPLAGLDLGHAAQWLGVMPQDGSPVLQQWAEQAGLGGASTTASAPVGDAAKVGASTPATDPARVGAAPESGDPADVQQPSPESR